MILNTSDEAARFVENVKGWVSRDGRFYGDDERSARWGGATHVPCADCGQPVEKNWIRCEQCREKAEIERHAKRERKRYDGGWVYSVTAQEFFEDEDALRDWLDDPDRNYTLESLRLVVCDPVYPHYIDADDLFCDDLPEDCSLRDVASELDEWIARANECIAGMIKCGSAISWRPGKFAVDVSTLPSDIFARRETPP